MLFIGPFDLSANAGHLGEPDHPDVRAAIARVEQAAKAADKLLGIIPTPGRSAAELFAAGLRSGAGRGRQRAAARSRRSGRGES